MLRYAYYSDSEQSEWTVGSVGCFLNETTKSKKALDIYREALKWHRKRPSRQRDFLEQTAQPQPCLEKANRPLTDQPNIQRNMSASQSSRAVDLIGVFACYHSSLELVLFAVAVDKCLVKTHDCTS